MGKIFRGVIDPSESRRLKVIEFSISPETSRVEVRFDYSPISLGGILNHVDLLLYDSMGRFVGRCDKNLKRIEISQSPSNGARSIFPLPGKWKAVLEIHEASSKIDYELEIKSSGDERYTWKMGELHSHSIHSDGIFTVTELGEYFKEEMGFDFFFLTDHSNISGWEELIDLDGIVGFPGQEINTLYGHMLVLGCRNFIDWKDEMMNEVECEKIRKFVKIGEGIVGIAHPFLMEDPTCMNCEWKYSDDPFSLDFVEVWTYLPREYEHVNERFTYEWIKYLRSGGKVVGTVGGDFHKPEKDYPNFLKTVVCVRRLILSEVLHSIKNGKVILSRGGMVELTIDGHDIGDTVEFENEDDLNLNLRIWDIQEDYELFLLTKKNTLKIGRNLAEFECRLKDIDLTNDDFVLLWIKDPNGRTLLITNPIFLRRRMNP